MFDIPNKDGQWMFTSPNTWQTWVKPNQYNNFIIYVCGAGGGGGAGQGRVAGITRTGAGGGGAGILNIINTPSFLLPETLYMNIGRGGAGGLSSQGNGAIGGVSYLTYYPNTNSANIIISSNGGNAGNGGGAAGATSTPYTNQSIFSFSGTNSSAGTNGGFPSIGPGTNFSVTTSCIYGGTGGGSIDATNVGFTGGNILASNIHPQLDGGAVATNGNNGYFIKKPFTSLGGTGGGGNPLGKGGTGGAGIFGSGGGGGGGGTSLDTSGGGTGGRGGDGFVIIIGY